MLPSGAADGLAEVGCQFLAGFLFLDSVTCVSNRQETGMLGEWAVQAWLAKRANSAMRAHFIDTNQSASLATRAAMAGSDVSHLGDENAQAEDQERCEETLQNHRHR